MNRNGAHTQQVDRLLVEINCYIDYLYITPDPYTRNAILNCMRQKLSTLYTIIRNRENVSNGPEGRPTLPLPSQRSYTPQELAAYDGKGGNPAYVAVDGIVYEVTNNAAWAAATHFGLVAGKDLTREFASCHPGQRQILSTLKVVGELTQ